MTIELLSGIERPPRREDYCTKIAGAPLAPAGAAHPLWDAFLNRVTAGNAELIAFLRRFLGYCMTGFTHEHVFMFLYGTGANGKGVFLNTITRIMGDYAIIAPMEMFLTSRFDRHPAEIAKLKGARTVGETGSECRRPSARRQTPTSPIRTRSGSGRTSISSPTSWPSHRQTGCSHRGRHGARSGT